MVNKINKKAQGMKSKISPASPFRKKAQMKNKNIFQLLHKKSGQMKIQQMSFMLLGVFLFFALVGMIILTVKFSDLKQSATDLKEQNALLLVTKLANSPEFSCGEVFGTQKTDCIDWDKVMILKENINKYSGFWGVSNIEIRRVYPENKEIECRTNADCASDICVRGECTVECTQLNYPKCNLITLIDKPSLGYSKSNFVALCRKEKYNEEIVNKCEMAKLIVRYEEVQ